MNCLLTPDLRLTLDGIPEATPGFRIEHDFTNDIGIVRLEFARTPQPFRVSWSMPQRDIQFRWTSMAGKIGENYPQFLPPAWLNAFPAEFTRNAPVFALVGTGGTNRLTFAASDAENRLELFAGVSEESFELECAIACSEFPEGEPYTLELRFDLRQLPFETALADTATWWESFYSPLPVPASAREMVYSTWYSYHREITSQAVETEVAAGRKLGLRSVIVDDGWQETGDAAGYAFAGSWRIDRSRFPDMEEHVARVRQTGIRYLLWIALPFVGEAGDRFAAMKGKLLYFAPGLNCWIVDPRFPDVREYLIERCVDLARSLKLDGLKIDFLDRFALPAGTEDPAEKEHYANRDYKSIPQAVVRLLNDLTARLRAISEEFLIEYRQDYIGPGMRAMANIFRASDCPGDRIANRRRVVNLRHLSGNTAVHSDMLGWHPEEPVESAARQIWNIVFSVPQISVQLESLPEEHREMLRFVLGFWREHASLFLFGRLHAPCPGENDPFVTVEGASETALVAYQRNQLLPLHRENGKAVIAINASASPELFLEYSGEPVAGRIFDCLGKAAGTVNLVPGLQKIAIPCSGVLVLS